MSVGRWWIVGCLGILTAWQSAAGQEWTRFRGPNGAGVSTATTVPAVWTEDDFNWRVKLPGAGHSSPVFWGEKVFLVSGHEETGARIVQCLDRTDGRTLWTREYPAAHHKKHQLNTFASSTPTVDAEALYVTWATPEDYLVTALDHGGRQLWQVDLGPFKSGHGFGISPILYADMVIVGNDQEGDSAILALDRRTGLARWRVDRDTKTTYSTPCVYRRPGRPDELIFTNWQHGIMGIDPLSGRTNWEIQVFDTSHIETSIGSPVVVGELILGTCGWLGHATHTVAVRPGDTADDPVKEVYRVDRGAPLTTTPVAHDGLLFLWADNGIVTCTDAATGEVHWQRRVGGKYYGSPVVVGEHVYCLSVEGEAVVLAASKDYRLIARNPLGETSLSTPAVADGTLYLRTASHLSSIGGAR
jgi:outer membrane protein assembly factor BamB